MKVCVLIYLWFFCQNDDLKHVAGIVTWNQEKKKMTKNDSLCIFVKGEDVFILGVRVQGAKAATRL